MNRAVNRVVDTLLATDAYKLDHRRQYPAGTEVVFSNLTARGTRIPDVEVTVFFGLQALLAQITERWDEFFNLDDASLDAVLAEYDSIVTSLLGTNGAISVGTDHFRALHAIGYLPLRIKAFREGSLVPLRSLLHDREHRPPGVLADQLSGDTSSPQSCGSRSPARLWPGAIGLCSTGAPRSPVTPTPSTSRATTSPAGAWRACTRPRPVAPATCSSFRGTDTLSAVRFIDRYYPGDNGIVAGSCPATEHSVMCAGGRDTEFETFERLLDLYPSGTLAVVSDTYDLWQVCTDFLPRLKDKITARDGKLVIRPDSGDPELILCGDPNAPEGSPANRG